MTAETLAMTAAALLSLLFEYAPPLTDWYGGQNEQRKRLIMLGLMVLVAAGAYGLSCVGQGDYFACSQAGAWEALRLLVAALAANQGTHLLTKKQ